MFETFANSLQSLETSTSILNSTLNINGSLTVSGAVLEFQLLIASVAVSGRIDACMPPLIPDSLHLIAITNQMVIFSHPQYLPVVIVVAAYRRERRFLS